jgi:RNA polymerase sigma-70 factor (ECF subfamily)
MNSATWIMKNAIISTRAPQCTRGRDDRALVEGFLSEGAEDCFERLVDRYKGKVFRLALSVMGPGGAAEAEDITQEVFLQVYRKLSTFRQESRFSTWLYRIAYHRALEHRQKARFRLPHQGEKALAHLTAPTADPQAISECRQRKRHILEALEDLDEPYRTVIHLHYWMRCSVAEIAEHLGTRPGTVKSYLHRGRTRLATHLQTEGSHG